MLKNTIFMKKISILLLSVALHAPLMAQNFNDYFEDRTLRTDYLFTGDAHQQSVCLDELSVLPQWAGRRTKLAELP